MRSTQAPKRVVVVGSRVKLSGWPEALELVRPDAVDLEHGCISIESPIGKVLLGKHVGERVVIATPTGQAVFVIERVETQD